MEAAIQINEAVRCVLDGDGLLFVGAGLSFLARSKNDQPVPDASTLVDLLLENPLKTGSKHPLHRVAGDVVRSKGVDFVYNILSNSFDVVSVDQKLRDLYALPWKRIYTTNYDNAIEVARKGMPISSLTVDENHANAQVGTIVHLNGFIKRVGAFNIERGLLLTDSSYAADRLIETKWLSFFLQDIKTSRAIIFAGYSLYDLDIDRVLLEAGDSSRKIFFFVSPDADQIEISTLERYGVVIPGGIDVLIKAIHEVSAAYKPPVFVGGLTALREITVGQSNNETKTAAQKIHEQLVYGILPEKEVISSQMAFQSQSYLVVREQDLEAQAGIRKGMWRDILFVGEIASGKSASTLILASFLHSEGYRVFYAEKSDSLISDLRRLSVVNEKIAVIFDGYSPFRGEIADYASRRKSGHRIILTERAGVHDFISDFISATAGLGPVLEIALNRITKNDAAAFESLTNFGGFWGEKAGLSTPVRERYIAEKLEGSLYRLLTEIIESEKVQAELQKLLKPLSYNIKASGVFCSALIMNTLGFPFTISEWQYLYDRNLIRSMLTNYSEQIRHFLTYDTDNIYIRNGLLSSHILHGLTDDEIVRTSLMNLYEYAEKSSSDARWKKIMIELMKFSSVEPIFSSENKSAHIFKFYDEIRVFGKTMDNPDYWLQLGIASTALGDLSRGAICFKNAYAREKTRSNPNLTRIDNYFARFNMQNAVAENDHDMAFKLFRDANSLIIKQIFLDTNRHYPFKAGRNLEAIAAKHYDAWDEDKRNQFRKAVTEIQKKAREWKASSDEISTDVELLIKQTGGLLHRLSDPI